MHLLLLRSEVRSPTLGGAQPLWWLINTAPSLGPGSLETPRHPDPGPEAAGLRGRGPGGGRGSDLGSASASRDQQPLVSEDQEEDEGPPQEGQAGSGQSGGRDGGMGLACGPQQEVKL